LNFNEVENKKELHTASLQVPLTPTQMKKMEQLSSSNVLTPAAFTRQLLVKTLKLKEA